MTAVAAKDGFNWGYDPYHWLAPEGSYATQPGRAGPGRRVPHDGRRTAQVRAARRTGPGLQPHAGGRSGADVRAGQGRARLLPAAERDRARWRRRPAAATSPPSTRWPRRSWSTAPSAGRATTRSTASGYDLMGHHSKANMLKVRRRAGQADPGQGRRGRQEHLPVRRGLELRRGRRTTRCSSRPGRATSAAPGSARSPTGCATASAAAARSTTTRGSRASAPARRATRTATRSTARRPNARSGSPTTPIWSSSGWPATCGRSRFRSAATGRRRPRRPGRLQRSAGRVRRPAGRGDQLRRCPRQRDVVGHADLQVADGNDRCRTGSG